MTFDEASEALRLNLQRQTSQVIRKGTAKIARIHQSNGLPRIRCDHCHAEFVKVNPADRDGVFWLVTYFTRGWAYVCSDRAACQRRKEEYDAYYLVQLKSKVTGVDWNISDKA